jgi:putative NIF3 family GTP cyclohydrolase 1 type 2
VPCNRLVGQPPRRITRVAICPGSGASLGRAAFDRGAQVFITGDIKYHDAQALEPLGLTVDAGHFSLEETMMRTWMEILARELAPLGIHVHFIPGHNPIRMG